MLQSRKAHNDKYVEYRPIYTFECIYFLNSVIIILVGKDIQAPDTGSYRQTRMITNSQPFKYSNN